MNKKIIAYDLGTGGNKASLYDSDGLALHSTFVAYLGRVVVPVCAETKIARVKAVGQNTVAFQVNSFPSHQKFGRAAKKAS